MRSTLFLVYNPSDPRQVTAAKLIGRISDRPVDSLDLNPAPPQPGPAAGAAPGPAQPAPATPAVPVPPPGDERALPLREELLRRFDRASKMLVLIDEHSHADPWIDWQVKAFYDLKDPVYTPNTWKVLRGMRLRACPGAPLPPALDGRSTTVCEWDPELMEDWLERVMDI